MPVVTYKVDHPNNFSEIEKEQFHVLLKKQGKITEPTIEKVKRCTLICICYSDNTIVSIGAIKPKTNSDFNANKANLDELRNEFKLELGYCYTLPSHTRKGHSTKIVQLLLENIKGHNLMASTELRDGNSMKGILERNEFKQYGNSWLSGIHGGQLGLFLRYGK
jgi:hypothetical protein